MILALGLSAALAASCDLEAPVDAPFQLAGPSSPGGAVLLVVVHGDTLEPQRVSDTFAALTSRGLHGTLSMQIEELDDDVLALVPGLIDQGHDLAARVPPNSVSSNAETGPRRLRKALRPLVKAAGKPRVYEGSAGRIGVEAVVHRVGFRALLESNGPASATPRGSQHLEGQPDNGVILPIGPYAGPCGATAIFPSFTPKAADRVTQALLGARTAPFGVVRVTLAPSSTDDLRVFERWLDEVVVPAGFPVLSARDARDRALLFLRDRQLPAQTTKLMGGRLVSLDQVRAAARDLEGATAVPRLLSGDLNPTEAWQAIALLISGRQEGEVVRLAALEGPPAMSTSALRGPSELSREGVIGLASALLDELPASVPAAMAVDGKLLNAPEMLGAFASALRGDDPVIVHPMAVPEPSSPGLGWGRSESP